MHPHILQLEEEGFITRTFRRLDPDRQEKILKAILDEAIAKGPTSLNIKEVAARAEVSVGSLYTYFGNRDGLLAFAVEITSRLLVDELNSFRPLLVELPLREGLQAYLLGGLEWSQTQSGLLRFFARAAYQGGTELEGRFVRPIASTLREMVEDMVKAAHQRGEIRPEVDLAPTIRLIHALFIAAGDSQLLPYLNNYFQLFTPDIRPERMTDALLSLILNGISTTQ